MGNEAESAAGSQLQFTWTKWATAAQVVAIAAGILAMACELLMWRAVAYTMVDLNTQATSLPSSVTNRGILLSLAPAGAGTLVAAAALTLRRRARWLRYPQIGLWLLALASSVYIAGTCAPFTGLGLLSGPLAVGDIAGVVTIVLLTLSLRRPAGRQPRWHLAFVLLAAALPCTAAGIAAAVSPTYGPGSGVLTGIVARCPPAKLRASGLDPDPSPVVTMSVWNQDGQIIASQSLPLRTSGARYHMRLAAGTYSIDASTALEGVQAGVRLYIPADKTIEEDFKDYSSSMCAGWLLHGIAKVV